MASIGKNWRVSKLSWAFLLLLSAFCARANLESDLLAIRAVCNDDDLERGNSTEEPSESCKSVVEARVAANESVRSAPSQNRGDEPCDGIWKGKADRSQGCCDANRFGNSGPSPVCRAVLMHGCDCQFDSNDTFIDCSKNYFRCSSWNGICWALCASYDQVKYCGWCGNDNSTSHSSLFPISAGHRRTAVAEASLGVSIALVLAHVV
eukprot:TRINITY_DN40365_c0_g1_i1.p1 TRINITY_DN40365_c0_g1~~TRINITY_DN40365_c0_g1_i1.p1  ORF type:complete len:207 (+),score=19.01 TRINITY_DN40365_c0_g1_i1:34-654(+)